MARKIKLNMLMPFLAHELNEALTNMGETELADSIGDVEIIGRCKCDSCSCGAFYTQEEHKWSGQQVRQVIPAIKGLYAIDVHEDEIVYIDVMGRTDVRERLVAVYP